MINSNRFFWPMFVLEMMSWCSCMCTDFIYFMHYACSLHTFNIGSENCLINLLHQLTDFFFVVVVGFHGSILQREIAALESGKCLFKSSFMRQEFLFGSEWSISQSGRHISLPERFRIIKFVQSRVCPGVVSLSHYLLWVVQQEVSRYIIEN